MQLIANSVKYQTEIVITIVIMMSLIIFCCQHVGAPYFALLFYLRFGIRTFSHPNISHRTCHMGVSNLDISYWDVSVEDVLH